MGPALSTEINRQISEITAPTTEQQQYLGAALDADEAAQMAATGVTQDEALDWVNNTPEGRAWKAEYDRTKVSVPGETGFVALKKYVVAARKAAGAVKKAKDDARAARIRANPCKLTTTVGDWKAVPSQAGKFTKSYNFTGACEEPYDKIIADTKQDCVYTWSDWNEVNCQTHGKKNRTLTVTKEPTANGVQCPLYRTEAISCGNAKQDCVMNEWSEWSACDPTSKTHTRTRTINKQPTWDGAACPRDLTETKTCSADCVGEWSVWAPAGCTDPESIQDSVYRIVKPKIGGGRQCDWDEGATRRQKCNANIGTPPARSPSPPSSSSPSPSSSSPPPSSSSPSPSSSSPSPSSSSTSPSRSPSPSPSRSPSPSPSSSSPSPSSSSPSPSSSSPSPSTAPSDVKLEDDPVPFWESLSTTTIILIVVGFLIAIGAIVLAAG
jgi:hypothetical protein